MFQFTRFTVDPLFIKGIVLKISSSLGQDTEALNLRYLMLKSPQLCKSQDFHVTSFFTKDKGGLSNNLKTENQTFFIDPAYSGINFSPVEGVPTIPSSTVLQHSQNLP